MDESISTQPIRKPVHRTCKYCHQSYEVQPGLKNARNLFRKPTWDEWFILILILLVVAGAYFYYTDTQQCRDFLNNMNQTHVTASPDLNNVTIGTLNQASGNLAKINSDINSIPYFPNGSQKT